MNFDETYCIIFCAQNIMTSNDDYPMLKIRQKVVKHFPYFGSLRGSMDYLTGVDPINSSKAYGFFFLKACCNDANDKSFASNFR